MGEMKKKAEKEEELVEKIKNGEEGAKKKKKNNKSEAQENGNNNFVELKVDMHCACEGCAHNIKKYLKKHLGVDRVNVYESNTKVKVKGNVDAWKLKELIETKFHRDVSFINPKNPPKKKEKGGADDAKAVDKTENVVGDGDKKQGKKKAEEKKAKPPAVCTVGLKIRLHCNGCTDRIKKLVSKFKGVNAVTVEENKDLVTVTGTMDVNQLVQTIQFKFKRNVELIGQKNNEKKEDKKEKGSEKKQKNNNNKEGEKLEVGNGPVTPLIPFDMLNRMDYYGPIGGYSYPPPGYHIVQTPAPQLFSDENPNACTIM